MSKYWPNLKACKCQLELNMNLVAEVSPSEQNVMCHSVVFNSIAANFLILVSKLC